MSGNVLALNGNDVRGLPLVERKQNARGRLCRQN
jgi:hypothetical protein